MICITLGNILDVFALHLNVNKHSYLRNVITCQNTC